MDSVIQITFRINDTTTIANITSNTVLLPVRRLRQTRVESTPCRRINSWCHRRKTSSHFWITNSSKRIGHHNRTHALTNPWVRVRTGNLHRHCPTRTRTHNRLRCSSKLIAGKHVWIIFTACSFGQFWIPSWITCTNLEWYKYILV